jgi:hypothetical protein
MMDPEEAPRAPRRAPLAEMAAVLLAALSTVAVVAVQVDDGAGARTLESPVLDGSGGYAFLHVDDHTGLPARFNPCASIAYVVNPDGAPAGALDDVHAAFARAALATGLTFTFEGASDEVPHADRAAYQPERYGRRWAPVLVAWTDLSDVPAGHRTDVLGWATPRLMTHPTRQDVIITGTLVLAKDGPAVRPGFGVGRRWGNVALHEVGHLLGLDHTHLRGEIMYPDARYGTGEWGAGDLAGLAHLGTRAGCLREPEPR